MSTSVTSSENQHGTLSCISHWLIAWLLPQLLGHWRAHLSLQSPSPLRMPSPILDGPCSKCPYLFYKNTWVSRPGSPPLGPSPFSAPNFSSHPALRASLFQPSPIPIHQIKKPKCLPEVLASLAVWACSDETGKKFLFWIIKMAHWINCH